MDVVRRELTELTGFDTLLDVLDHNLFRRSRFLHAFHIVQKAIAIVERLRYKAMADARSHDRDMRARRNRFLEFVRNAKTIDPEVASELAAYLDAYGPRTNHESRLAAAYTDTAGELAALRQRLNEFDEDLQALKLLERIADDFTPAERDELRALFGVYGDDVMRRANGRGLPELGQRQRYWRRVIRPYQPEAYRLVAERAVNRYGLLISAKKRDESNANNTKEHR
ncbi:MAG: hypothetical protein KatS3mg105_5174 [Gemmatales bacterium]|nr:MAG: hypothetical protein KatS3mg105_5174 [Gemmatales bacterium]